MSEYMSDQEIYDQFAEAAAALIMRQYAAAERKTAMKAAPEVKTSQALDAKCHKLIKKRLRTQQLKTMAKTVLRYTKRVAMVVLMLFGIVGILFTTVEAVRVPIINFFIDQKDGYLEISGIEGEQSNSKNEKTDVRDPLDGLLPEGYELIMYEKYSNGGFAALYENKEKAYVRISEKPHTATLFLDNTDTITEHISGLLNNAVLIEKEGYRLAWVNRETNQMCCLDADALSREEIIALAEKIEIRR